MADLRGFLKVARQKGQYRQVCERIKDFKGVDKLRSVEQSQEQASRCMDCGTPFCHWGCPIGNYIPEWNNYMFAGNWQAAFYLLDATNNLPEITGRVCPAPCEHACVLGLNSDPVTIRENELAVIEQGFQQGLIKPKLINKRTNKKIAVVGSGPAGLSCATQLNQVGHNVVVFERDNKPGGILRYGIPDFKLEKKFIDRRINIYKSEGIVFKTGLEVGRDYPVKKLYSEFDAICLAGGAGRPRDLEIEGRKLNGIYFAMDYLIQANQRVAGEKIRPGKAINAKGKKVVVIGGGDTGADCVGVAHRQGACCVVQLEVMPKPSQCRSQDYPWPSYPLILKTSTSHEEGGIRHWSVLTKRFLGKKGVVKKISCVNVEFSREADKACPTLREIPETKFEIEADLVIIAIGFLGPEHSNMLKEFNVEFDQQGNVKTNLEYRTSVDKVFSAGDMRRGQSLVVSAISEGRRCAHFIDKYLVGQSNLPSI